jgi:hypothetical protein
VYTRSTKVPKIAFLAGAFDEGIRRTGKVLWKDLLRHPQRLFDPIYMQSIGIIQGPDLLEDGRVDMCESCPDMTVWDGRLVHSCRLDEWRLYGNYVTPRPRAVAEAEGATNGKPAVAVSTPENVPGA